MMDESRKRHVLFWSVAVLGAALDLVSKYAVFAKLGPPPAPGCGRSIVST